MKNYFFRVISGQIWVVSDKKKLKTYTISLKNVFLEIFENKLN